MKLPIVYKPIRIICVFALLLSSTSLLQAAAEAEPNSRVKRAQAKYDKKVEEAIEDFRDDADKAKEALIAVIEKEIRQAKNNGKDDEAEELRERLNALKKTKKIDVFGNEK